MHRAEVRSAPLPCSLRGSDPQPQATVTARWESPPRWFPGSAAPRATPAYSGVARPCTAAHGVCRERARDRSHGAAQGTSLTLQASGVWAKSLRISWAPVPAPTSPGAACALPHAV